MADAGTLTVTITGDASKLSSAISAAKSEVSSFSSSSLSVGDAVSSAFTGMALKATALLGSLQLLSNGAKALQDIGSYSLEMAGNFEQSRIAFEVMLGSGDKASKLLTDIGDFARKTPFDLPQVVEGAKRLLAYNIDAEKLLPTLKSLGNIAAGVGTDKLPQLILAFGQVRAATYLTGAELRQFTEAGVPLLDMLAKQSGKTASQIKSDMESGIRVPFSEVEKAINSMSGEGGRFFNLMEKQSGTFQGTMSNLRDGMFRFALALMGVDEAGNILAGGAFSMLKDKAQTLLTWIDANQETLKKYSAQIGAFIAAEGTAFVSYVKTNLIPALIEMKKKFDEAWPAIRDNLIPAFRDLFTNIGMLMPFLIQLSPLFYAIGEMAKQPAQTIRLLADSIEILISPLRLVNDLLSKFKQLLQSPLTSDQTNLANAYKQIGVSAPASAGFSNRRAAGGPVSGSTPYLVGEKGPELFVPSTSGSIRPNGATNNTSNVTVNINGTIQMGSDYDVDQFSKRLGDQLRLARLGV